MKQGIVVLMLGFVLWLMVQGAEAVDVQMNGNVGVSGSVTASSFVGDGSGLNGVEKRTAISACGTISKSGSYYVAQDLTTTGTCITVTADDVTIDLNGFNLTGDGSGTTDYGVHINNVSNVEVKNGTVRSFSQGIYAGWSGTATVSNRVLNVRAIENGYGIHLGSLNNLVKDCNAAESTDPVGSGISASNGSTVTNNTACNNQGIGIIASIGSTVTQNTVYNNQNHGISTAAASSVTHNTVYNNQDHGIATGSGSSVTHNTVYSNNQSNGASNAGIAVGSGCLVKNNTLRSNLQNNIRVGGDANAIEENLVTDSGNGICFATFGNFYANNRARDNTTNYNTGGFAQTDGGGNVGF